MQKFKSKIIMIELKLRKLPVLIKSNWAIIKLPKMASLLADTDVRKNRLIAWMIRKNKKVITLKTIRITSGSSEPSSI